MATDIIARGMASKADVKAQSALDELAMVIEGTMNAEETQFTDLGGHVVTPDQNTVYHDMTTYVYYRWNGTNYYTVSDPRDTVRFTPQTLSSDEQEQARSNIGAQETLQSGVNLKTINGLSLMGSGNIEAGTWQPFNPDWPTTTTLEALLTAVRDDAAATVGMGYLGEVSCSGLPFAGNAELVIEIMNQSQSSKVMLCQITSANVAPYHWEATYWSQGLTPWRAMGLCRTGTRTLASTDWDNGSLEINISGLTTHDYVHVIGASVADGTVMHDCGVDYTLANGKIVFTAVTTPVEDINIQLALISGVAL